MTKPEPTIEHLALEISYGSRWVNLNDHMRYELAAESTRESSSQTWRKVTATSPVLSGSYLIHAVPEMVQEQVVIWVRGNDQAELNEALAALNQLFTQYDYRLRWTIDGARETWNCQLADAVSSRGQVWTHSKMAKVAFNVPRFPEVTNEVIAS